MLELLGPQRVSGKDNRFSPIKRCLTKAIINKIRHDSSSTLSMQNSYIEYT